MTSDATSTLLSSPGTRSSESPECQVIRDPSDISPTTRARRFPGASEPRTTEVVRGRATAGYCTRLKIEKIGMYSAMIMPPMSDPRTTIMSGSIRLVSCSVVDSTSWS